MKKVILIFILIATLSTGVGLVYFLKLKNTENTKDTVTNISVTSDPTISENIEPASTEPTNIEIKKKEQPKSKCDGLRGELEMQVLVGPADAVGMTPVAVGSVPFSVINGDDTFMVQGGGNVSYNETLEQVWGTYTVTLEMDGTIEGTCSGNVGEEALDVVVEMTGNQMTEVRAEGFSGDYPWEGTQTLDLSFPLVEGATSEGEGWAFVLHISE